MVSHHGRYENTPDLIAVESSSRVQWMNRQMQKGKRKKRSTNARKKGTVKINGAVGNWSCGSQNTSAHTIHTSKSSSHTLYESCACTNCTHISRRIFYYRSVRARARVCVARGVHLILTLNARRMGMRALITCFNTTIIVCQQQSQQKKKRSTTHATTQRMAEDSHGEDDDTERDAKNI